MLRSPANEFFKTFFSRRCSGKSKNTAFGNRCPGFVGPLSIYLCMNSSPYILGISASHNGSVCLLRGEDIVVAIQEERLTRTKRERLLAGRSSLAVPYCLQQCEHQYFRPEHDRGQRSGPGERPAAKNRAES